MNAVVTHRDFLFIPCPEDYWCFHFTEEGDIEAYPEDGGGGIKPIGWHFFKRDLPPDNYDIVGLAKDLTEDQWKEITPYIERVYGGSYYDYTRPVGNNYHYVGTATESGLSLLKANNLTNPLIIKKII